MGNKFLVLNACIGRRI